jgi:hypothetical protein
VILVAWAGKGSWPGAAVLKPDPAMACTTGIQPSLRETACTQPLVPSE